jgi:hypothetical protein
MNNTGHRSACACDLRLVATLEKSRQIHDRFSKKKEIPDVLYEKKIYGLSLLFHTSMPLKFLDAAFLATGLPTQYSIYKQ